MAPRGLLGDDLVDGKELQARECKGRRPLLAAGIIATGMFKGWPNAGGFATKMLLTTLSKARNHAPLAGKCLFYDVDLTGVKISFKKSSMYWKARDTVRAS